MEWARDYLPEAQDEMEELDGSVRSHVVKAIRRVAQNPRLTSEGGYGKPLGNKFGIDLTGLLKIKLRADGVHVVYKLEERDGKMVVVVVGVRADEEVYREAYARRTRSGL